MIFKEVMLVHSTKLLFFSCPITSPFNQPQLLTMSKKIIPFLVFCSIIIHLSSCFNNRAAVIPVHFSPLIKDVEKWEKLPSPRGRTLPLRCMEEVNGFVYYNYFTSYLDSNDNWLDTPVVTYDSIPSTADYVFFLSRLSKKHHALLLNHETLAKERGEHIPNMLLFQYNNKFYSMDAQYHRTDSTDILGGFAPDLTSKLLLQKELKRMLIDTVTISMSNFDRIL